MCSSSNTTVPIVESRHVAIDPPNSKEVMVMMNGKKSKFTTTGEIIYGFFRLLFVIFQNIYHIPTYLFFTWIVFLPVYYLKPMVYKRIENFLYTCCLHTVGSWSWLANLQVIECGDDIYKIAPRPPTSVILASNGGSNNNSRSSPIHHEQQLPLSSPERCQRVNTPSPNPSLIDIPLNSPDHHSSPSNQHHSRSKSSDHINESINDDVARINSINAMNSSASSNVPLNATGNNNNGMMIGSSSKSRSCQDTKVLLMANHQSTGDVPLMFQAFSTSNHYILLWIMDHQFKYTNFGVVSATHGDYFIKPRNFVKSELTKHCLNAPEKNMILLFPEGGFRYKRMDSSDKYAAKHGWQSLHHLTWPRSGAFLDATDGSLGVTHIVDLTILYQDLDDTVTILDIAMGRRPQPVYFHYRIFEVTDDVTLDEHWLNARWVEKEALMKSFYDDQSEFIRSKCSNGLRPVQMDYFRLIMIQVFYFISSYIYYLLITFAVISFAN